MPLAPSIALCVLGRTVYTDALDLQRRLHAARVRSEIGDLLLLTEHDPVLTLGRAADGRHLRVTRELLQERGWSREQAYIICSVAVDLRVSNVVDLPNVTVSAFLPEDIFQG